MFVSLEELATVSLGYKSLQNDFFYVNQATIDTYAIEKQFLKPVLMLRELEASVFEQTSRPQTWLFHCQAKAPDLRGMGALRYIDAMADVSASEKKQTGKRMTVREVLTAQGGGLWYAPKARANKHNVWIRKAFDGVFAPFLFEEAVLVDQRCNSISPRDDSGLGWEQLAAVLTATTFAYSVEINGSTSMGAGVLEAPTTKIRGYPVLNIKDLTKAECKKLLSLARAVWSKEAPVDWSLRNYVVGEHLRALDQWVFNRLGTAVTLPALYRDLHEACQARIGLAKDKVKKSLKKKTDNIGNVADAIASGIVARIKSKNFPEDFIDGDLDLDFTVSRELVRSIRIAHFMQELEITFLNEAGDKVVELTQPKSQAEAIVRAVLWGRSSFQLSSNGKAMDSALTDFLQWAVGIDGAVTQAIAESALGTGYESQLRREVYQRLGVDETVTALVLPTTLILR